MYLCRYNNRLCVCVCVYACMCVCVYACMRVLSILSIKRPNHLNVNRNIIELMKVKVLAQSKNRFYLCGVNPTGGFPDMSNKLNSYHYEN